MDKKDMERMEALMEVYQTKQMEKQWRDNNDYSRAFLNQMQDEIESHWRFMAWLKMTYPEALQEYRAVQAIAR